MTLFGMQLYSCYQNVSTERPEHLLNRIDFFQAREAQKRESSEPKASMENINHITRPICETAVLWVL